MKNTAQTTKSNHKNGTSKRNGERRTNDLFLRKLHKLAIPRPQLPDDFAVNHDYYLYGTHKQQPRRGRWIPLGKALRRPTQAQVAAFNRKMEEFAAEIEGLPSDLAKNLDHYLHGHPKV